MSKLRLKLYAPKPKFIEKSLYFTVNTELISQIKEAFDKPSTYLTDLDIENYKAWFIAYLNQKDLVSDPKKNLLRCFDLIVDIVGVDYLMVSGNKVYPEFVRRYPIPICSIIFNDVVCYKDSKAIDLWNLSSDESMILSLDESISFGAIILDTESHVRCLENNPI